MRIFRGSHLAYHMAQDKFRLRCYSGSDPSCQREWTTHVPFASLCSIKYWFDPRTSGQGRELQGHSHKPKPLPGLARNISSQHFFFFFLRVIWRKCSSHQNKWQSQYRCSEMRRFWQKLIVAYPKAIPTLLKQSWLSQVVHPHRMNHHWFKAGASVIPCTLEHRGALVKCRFRFIGSGVQV